MTKEFVMVNIFACGDIVNYSNKTGIICDKALYQSISEADYSIANFEAPVFGFGDPIPKSGPHHSQRVETIAGLKKMGFDAILLANNHMLDYGHEGLLATIKEAEKNQIETVGAGINYTTAYIPLIKDIKGLKIGIVNASEAQFGVYNLENRNKRGGYAWINDTSIDRLIVSLKKSCDFVLVFSHAGLENYPIPQIDWRDRYQFLCSLGADVIVGSHPHIPQGYERFGDSLIFYSLGNFYFDGGRWKGKRNDSFSIILQLEKNRVPEFKPIFHHVNRDMVVLSSSDERIDLEELNELLSKKYTEEHRKMVLTAYKNVQYNLLRGLAPFPINTSIFRTLKEIFATILGRRKSFDKKILALHMIRNESYYYVARCALEYLNDEKKI